MVDKKKVTKGETSNKGSRYLVLRGKRQKIRVNENMKETQLVWMKLQLMKKKERTRRKKGLQAIAFREKNLNKKRIVKRVQGKRVLPISATWYT